MKIAAQFKLSQFVLDGKVVGTHGELCIEGYPRLSKEAAEALLAAHKSYGLKLVKMAPKTVTIKSEEAAARHGRKVGDNIQVIDYLSRDLQFDAVIGRAGVASVSNIERVTMDLGDDLDFGEVVDAKPRAQKPTTQTATDADELG